MAPTGNSNSDAWNGISIEVRPGATDVTVLVSGEVDVQTASGIAEAVEPFMKKSCSIRLDLSGTTFFDSQGIAVLLRIRRKAEEAEADLTLVSPSERVVKILSVAGLIDYFKIVDKEP